MAAAAVPPQLDDGLIARFEAYDFDADEAFQAVVTPLLNRLELAGALTPAQRDAVLLRAQVSHYSKSVESLSLEDYKFHLSTRSASASDPPRAPHPPPARSPLPPADGQPRPPRGFAEIGALIAQGQAGELVGDDVDDVTVHPPEAAAAAAPANPTPAALKPWERALAPQHEQ